MSSIVTSLNYCSTAQEIVNWVTTADGSVHAADTTQLNSTRELSRISVGGMVCTGLNTEAVNLWKSEDEDMSGQMTATDTTR